MDKKALGNQGEKLAQKYLKKQGYKIVKLNYSCQSGEIDIIAQDHGVLVFVEVRSKSSTAYGLPSETVDLKKQKKIKNTALHYLLVTNKLDDYCRFDVVSVIWLQNKAEITLLRDAF